MDSTVLVPKFGASTTVFSFAFNCMREYFCWAFVLMRLAAAPCVRLFKSSFVFFL